MSEEKRSFNFKVMNFTKDNNIPTFKESRNGEWVEYGDKNNYPQFLLETFHNRSNKHKAIINKKAMMCSGNGLVYPTNPSREYIEFVNNTFSNNTLDEIASKISFDLEIYGGFALKVKWSRDKTRIASVDYLPYQKVRLCTDDNYYYVCKDWSQHRKAGFEPIKVPRFSQLTKEEDGVQILYFIEDQPGMEYYPIPMYSPTLTYIESDWEIGNFHLNSIKNGFSAGFILNFATGVPSAEEMDMAYREFERNYSGSGNAGKFILTFSDGQDSKPELIPIELNSTDDRFILLNEMITSEIFIGHQVVSPMLFGVRVEGQLGGRDELKDAMELFQSTYVSFQQKKIENILNKLARVNGVAEEIKLAKYELFQEDINNNVE